LHRFGQRLAPLVIVLLNAIDTDNLQIAGQKMIASEIVKSRHEQAFR
jgi:hypothetical protein